MLKLYYGLSRISHQSITNSSQLGSVFEEFQYPAAECSTSSREGIVLNAELKSNDNVGFLEAGGIRKEKDSGSNFTGRLSKSSLLRHIVKRDCLDYLIWTNKHVQYH